MKKLLCTPLLFLSLSVIADDTEIFTHIPEAGSSDRKSNILFLFDNSGSMTYDSAGYGPWHWRFTGPSRMAQLKAAANTLLSGLELNSMKIGLMTFNGDRKLLTPVKLLTAAHKTELLREINALSGDGGTPLASSLYEAYRYYYSLSPEYGTYSSGVEFINSATKNYISPVPKGADAATTCGAKDSIVLFTDGQPNDDDDPTGVETLIASYKLEDHNIEGFNDLSKNCTTEGNCLDELAWYLQYNDYDAILTGKQSFSVHTIGGFGMADTSDAVKLLKSAAKYSKGSYTSANNPAQIASAFAKALKSIAEETATFVTPSVSLDYFNPLQHNDEQYYVMFKPSNDANWKGNLKKYKLINGVLKDANSNNATDSTTGAIVSTAQSYWSTTADGNDVTQGGMANKLPDDRNMYTNVSGDSDVALSDSGNRLRAGNDSLWSYFGSGIDSREKLREIINWLNSEKKIGDPLHTSPTVITYFTEETTDASGTKTQNYDSTVYFGTNQGFLHAVDTKTGIEKFAFIPKDHLSNILDYKNKSAGRVYGLDGPITAWVNDVNGNGQIVTEINGTTAETTSTTPAIADFAYLYVGERRGGRKYYALDVTNRNAPTLKWTISGGGTGNFSELGQTWSKPVLTKVKLNGVVKDVLFFGGGYDDALDVTSESTHTMGSSTMGRAIYMVDAKTGARLWWASSTATSGGLELTNMTHSIPSDLTVFDIDGDTYADRIFTVDIAGNLWRLDIKTENTGADDFATGGIIAKLSGTDSANSRHFFNAPSVALMRERGTEEFLAIAVGSGIRTNPLNETIQDKFYLIKDYNVYSPPTSSSSGTSSPDYSYIGDEVIKETNLTNATTNIGAEYGSLTAAEKADATNAKVVAYNSLINNRYGWYVNIYDLNDTATIKGEKVLAKASITSGIVFFTTYQPSVSAGASACSPKKGKARMYAMSIKDAATPASLITDSDQRDKRHIVLKSTGIPGRPAVLQQPGATTGSSSGGIVKRVCGGPGECLTPPSDNPLQKVFWRENLEGDAATSGSASTGATSGTPATGSKAKGKDKKKKKKKKRKDKKTSP